jgi:hypothetical protein
MDDGVVSGTQEFDGDDDAKLEAPAPVQQKSGWGLLICLQSVDHLSVPENIWLDSSSSSSEPVTIGRNPSCSLQIEDPLISSKHCSFFIEGKDIVLQDSR